jgi:hypothetical protein
MTCLLHLCQKANSITNASFLRLFWLILQVSSKAAADFILGTCHKAKGCEEDYVQLADDFEPIRAGRQQGMEVRWLPSSSCRCDCWIANIKRLQV